MLFNRVNGKCQFIVAFISFGFISALAGMDYGFADNKKEAPANTDANIVSTLEYNAAPANGVPSNPVAFAKMRVTDTWKKYADVLSWGKGQTLAILDDGCEPNYPAWQVRMPWGPKVVAGYDSVDTDNDPSPIPPGYHGTTIAGPSSVNYKGKLGVAFNNSLIHIRAVTVVHLRKDETPSIARALQWVIDNHKKYNITTINFSALDDQEHAEAVPTIIDEKFATLRKLGIWVSAPCGNHHFTKGISWPACQPGCFAIGATKQNEDVAHLDRFSNTDILAPATATSSSNAHIVGSSMILREAIEKSKYDWHRNGQTLPDAMMNIFKKTGADVNDPGTNLKFKRLDLLAAVDYVFANAKK